MEVIRALYKPLDEGDVRKIADSAFRVLEEGGVAVHSEEAREWLRRAGAVAKDDGITMKLPRSLVEDAIDSNPSSVTLYSRDGENDCVLEGANVYYGTGGTAIYVLDPETGERRESTLEDVMQNARFVEQLENIDLFTINVFPNDVKERDEIDINRFFHSLDNTKKHVMGGIYSLNGCKEVIRMAELIAGGEEGLRNKPFVSFITLMISPFKLDGTYGDMTCHIAAKGLPVVVPAEPICGTTSPVTLAGNILTHIAETLAGISLVQCVNKGAPGICGSVGSITNLKTMDHVGGAIERSMINAAVAQLAQHFELPLYSTAGSSDAKTVDIQASYESAMSNLLVGMSGANYIHDAAGLMETDPTVSYKKLVMDNEILGMCGRVIRGIEVTDETLGTALMIEKGPGKDYIADEHTVKHMRGEFFMPVISDRSKRSEDAPAVSAADRAAAMVREILAEKPVSHIDPDVRRDVLSNFPRIKQLVRENSRETR